jgi:hypothetical protein
MVTIFNLATSAYGVAMYFIGCPYFFDEKEGKLMVAMDQTSAEMLTTHSIILDKIPVTSHSHRIYCVHSGRHHG